MTVAEALGIAIVFILAALAIVLGGIAVALWVFVKWMDRTAQWLKAFKEEETWGKKK